MAASASNLLLPKDLLYKSRKVKWGDSKYGYYKTFYSVLCIFGYKFQMEL